MRKRGERAQAILRQQYARIAYQNSNPQPSQAKQQQCQERHFPAAAVAVSGLVSAAAGVLAGRPEWAQATYGNVSW